jgi:hypothetical protein
MRHPAVALALSLLLPIPVGSLADEGTSPTVGARVRVTAPSVSRELFQDEGRRIVGTLVSLTDETLTVQVSGHDDPAAVSRSSVQRFEISRSRSKKRRGLLIGFLVGTGIGVGLAAASGGSSACDSTSLSGCDVLLGTILLGLPGAIIGAVAAPGERWDEIPLGRVGLTITPTRGHGVAAAISFSF